MDETPSGGAYRSPWPIVLVAVLAGLALGALAFALGGDHGGRSSTEPTINPSIILPTTAAGPRPSAAAVEAFLAALRRSKTATYRVEEELTRTDPNGVVVLDEPTTRAQRPPDSVVRGLRSFERVQAGVRTGCATAPSGATQFSCKQEPAPAPDVDGEIRAAAALVQGPSAAYGVGHDAEGCFVLTLRLVGALAPPYGRRATLCFDRSTGAASRTVVEKPLSNGTDVAVDRTEATKLSPDVADADFALPPGAVVS